MSEPPPSDDVPCTTGLGVSDDSGPVQSTTEPSEYVWRTWNDVVPGAAGQRRLEAEDRVLVGGHVAARPDDLLPTACRPSRLRDACRVQPGSGSNESIANAARHRQLDLVVVAPCFSVGTARVNCCSMPVLRHGRADRGMRERGRREDERDREGEAGRRGANAPAGSG